MNQILWSQDSRMTDFVAGISGFHLPRWEQIPALGLYMDQVVTVIEEALLPILSFTGEAFITSSMVNNYVKLGMVKKPEKKKYNREHIAGLIVITILKQSLAIGDIRLGIDAVVASQEQGRAYDSFCDYLERALGIVADGVVSPENRAVVELDGDPMIIMATCSFATKIFAAKMLSIVREGVAEEAPIPEPFAAGK